MSDYEKKKVRNLHRTIDEVRKRAAALNHWNGIFAALGIVIVYLGVGALMTSWLPWLAMLRVPFWALAGVLGIGTYWWQGPRFLRYYESDEQIAKLIERECPEVGDVPINAIQLEKELESGTSFSRDLIGGFLRKAEETTTGVEMLISLQEIPVFRHILYLFLAFVLFGVLYLFPPTDLDKGFAHLIYGPPVAAPPAEAKRELTLSDLSVTYHFPDYLNRSPRNIQGSDGNIQAPLGTEVLLEGRLSWTANSVRFVVNGETQARPSLDKNGQFQVRFALMSEGTYHFESFDEAGEPTATADRKIRTEDDRRPKVQITGVTPRPNPQGRIEIEKSGAVRLDYRCTDDHGIGEVFLEYQSGGSRHTRQIATSSTGRKSINSQYEWGVPGSGGRLSKKLALRIGARDKDNISGPKTGYSRTITVHLVTDEMRHRRILARQEQLKRRMVNLLADELIFATAPLKPGKNLTADQAVLRSLHDIMLLNQLILREMRGDPLVDQTFYDELTSMLERRESENAALRKALRESRRVPPAGRKNEESREANISQAVREIVPPLEDDIIQLDDLLEMAHLRSARRMAERMAKMQQELAKLIRKMKEGGLTAEELQQIKQRIAAMKRMMDELSRRLAMSARKIEREFMNPDALQTLGMREELAEKLDNLQEMAEKGRLDEALSEAEKLSQQLQNMMQGLSQSGQRLAAARMSPYLRKLRKFQQDLNRIREEQADIRDATSAIRRKMREEIVRNEAGDLESFTKKQLKRAEQISQEIEKVLERARNTPDLEQYRTLRQKLRNKLREMATAEGEGAVNRLPEKLSGELEDITSQMRSLKGGDAADSILSGAEKAKDEVKQLKKSLENYDFQKALKRANNTRREMQEWGNICKRAGSPREMTQHASSAADTAAKISNDIRKMAEKIQKAGRSGASGAHGKSAQVIGGRQRQTLQKLRDARGQKGRVGNQEMKNALDQADRHMDSATAGLSKRHIGRPLEDQQAALEQLDRAIQEGKGKIQQMQQNMQGRAARMAGGRAGREGRSGAGRDRVQIPDPSAYRVPEEFREQIQKALSDGLPSDHREANERYFEDLVE